MCKKLFCHLHTGVDPVLPGHCFLPADTRISWEEPADAWISCCVFIYTQSVLPRAMWSRGMEEMFGQGWTGCSRNTPVDHSLRLWQLHSPVPWSKTGTDLTDLSILLNMCTNMDSTNMEKKHGLWDQWYVPILFIFSSKQFYSLYWSLDSSLDIFVKWQCNSKENRWTITFRSLNSLNWKKLN